MTGEQYANQSPLVITLAELLALARLTEWDNIQDAHIDRIRPGGIGIKGSLYRHSIRQIIDPRGENDDQKRAIVIECRIPFRFDDLERPETLRVKWHQTRWSIPRYEVNIKPSEDSKQNVSDQRIGRHLPAAFSDIDVDRVLTAAFALGEADLDPNDRFRVLVRTSGLSRRQVASELGVSLDTVHNWMAPARNRRFRQCPEWAVEAMEQCN